MNAIFRPAALNARQAKWLGDIVLIRPVSFAYLTALAGTLALVVVCFLVWGTYTKRSTVTGQLIPDTGLVKVFVPQPGIVLENHVVEGQRVTQGDVLYVLSSERQSSTQGNTQETISSQVEARQRSLRDELEKTRAMQTDDREALVKKIAGLQAELAKLDSQIEGQKSRVQLSTETLSRYEGLLAQDYISREQLQQKQEELLDQRNRLQGQERDRISVNRELTALHYELANLSVKQQKQLAQIEREITSTAQELTESEAKRRLVITAPETGIATAVSAEVGQAVDTSKPLVSVVPNGAILQAHLYAPSKAVGFVKAGDAVLLRYQAYPYQKFGHAEGKVISVSKTAIPGNELAGIGNLSNGAAGGNNEPLYRVTVDIAAQTINAYGKPQHLQAGMLLEADVLQDTRRLYEWVLEPLYSLTGKL
ncbi:HlyD family secretion protein [Methylomonas albis]|uniref:HlyD family efflux transporter periplasmic adaptor subunit n=1 Tax=Methylomonas albis TaxID=1854563 RepID=A0ABR9D0G5_9GAMM|nr:HlyD family efflux transporter periplasmic adaptor subunit [Methylomonas albis]MBD9356306.1 HlyD family efflux transporter periplasmic adaptor subunit [Methylomonas albis]